MVENIYTLLNVPNNALTDILYRFSVWNNRRISLFRIRARDQLSWGFCFSKGILLLNGDVLF